MSQSVYWHTPSMQVQDPRTLGIRQVEYLRKMAGEEVQSLTTCYYHDVAGRPVAQRDPRLPTPNTVTLFALNGQALRTVSVDAGMSIILPGLAGLPEQSWDANGDHRVMTYDDQLRPLTIEENGIPDVETMTYANSAHDAGHNLRGQLIKLDDPSGTIEFHSVGLTGNGLHETRTFRDDKSFASHRSFSPLGTVLSQTDAGGHQQLSTYDVAGQLSRVQLQLNGVTTWQTVLQDARYNAAGQIIEQRAGNGVISHWHYRATDGRLDRHSVQKDSGPVLQDFEYEYDRTGNISRILDHAYTPTFFRNQRVDGHREFRYDTLYRLIHATGYTDAPPSDNLGRPQPSDPADRRNYIEHYEYDNGDNLVKTVHIRDGANHTAEMLIDPSSNRGVRWKQGDPPPDFTKLFDPVGNLQALQPGVPMQWNNRGELDRVILVDRDGSSANDEEYYHYSQGERVYKRHDTHTIKASHFHEVRYLPGLEIRTRDNGEELHLINLSLASGNVVCLHWVAGKPAGIEADQLRYTQSDHLGSVSLELDQQARMISHEGYLPFGTTAWMVARTVIEVDYRFIRCSGKEMDVTRLYYYGARYYADWLGRWISTDPAGIVDGLNLYAFVGNNPITFIDDDGRELWDFMDSFLETGQQRSTRQSRSAADQQQYKADMALSRAVGRHTKILDLTTRRAREAETQINNHQSALAHGQSAALRIGAHVAAQAISYGAGIGIGATAAALGSVAGPPGIAVGATLGVVTKKAVSMGLDFALERTSLSASVKFKSGKLDPNRIINKGDYKAMNYGSYAYNKFKGIGLGVVQMNRKGWLKGGKEALNVGASIGMKAANTPFSSEIGAALSTVTGTFEILHEIAGAGLELTDEKLTRADQHISGMIEILNEAVGVLDSLFEAAGRDAIHTYRPLGKIFGNAAGDTRESVITATNATIRQLRQTQSVIRRARQGGT
ncbi:RHS repeat-associated core domain-containing protein [Pseudomonas sp. COW5]|uniref:RHS repeat-associated core domain-containing protein n=1 Tax=Pseudomonas sp. COW5 TaxID=2981253 RepID=UPI002245FA03|nr:RHS repeat-associated core domain-containing protein [Pseudomonas sp. COW5]MCX2544685.1 RHS repeat-associated core domain-containing protein [Pseudomonas sp. COW5]